MQVYAAAAYECVRISAADASLTINSHRRCSPAARVLPRRWTDNLLFPWAVLENECISMQVVCARVPWAALQGAPQDKHIFAAGYKKREMIKCATQKAGESTVLYGNNAIKLRFGIKKKMVEPAKNLQNSAFSCRSRMEIYFLYTPLFCIVMQLDFICFGWAWTVKKLVVLGFKNNSFAVVYIKIIHKWANARSCLCRKTVHKIHVTVRIYNLTPAFLWRCCATSSKTDGVHKPRRVFQFSRRACTANKCNLLESAHRAYFVSVLQLARRSGR